MGDIFCWFKISQEFCLRCWFFWNRDVGWALSPARRLGLRWFPTLRWLFARTRQASVYENVVNGLGNESFFCSDAPHRRRQRQLLRGELKWNSLDLGNFQELFKHPESHMEKNWTNDRISWNFLLWGAWMWTFRSLAPRKSPGWVASRLLYGKLGCRPVTLRVSSMSQLQKTLYNQIKSIWFFCPSPSSTNYKTMCCRGSSLCLFEHPMAARCLPCWSAAVARRATRMATAEKRTGFELTISPWPNRWYAMVKVAEETAPLLFWMRNNWKNRAIFKGQADGHGQEMPMAGWDSGADENHSTNEKFYDMLPGKAAGTQRWPKLWLGASADQHGCTPLQAAKTSSSKPKCFARGLFHHCLHGWPWNYLLFEAANLQMWLVDVAGSCSQDVVSQFSV